MKATDVIKRDHRAAEELFATYKKANQEDREAMEEKIFAALDAHESMEDTYFYPALQAELGEDSSFEDLETQQTELEEELTQIKAMSGDRSETIKSMMDKVLVHAKREEKEVLSKADEVLSEDQLEELGAKMEPLSAVAKSEE